MSPVKMFQIITLGVPVDLPVREQVAASSLQTLTQLTACLASIVNRKLQSGNDQIRRRRSKHPETITSFDVSKSDTGMQKKVEKFLVAKYALLHFCMHSQNLLPHSFSWARKCFLICIVLISIRAIVPSIEPVTT